MKQVSLRRFRDDVSEIHEVVEVSRRDPSGNIQVLGFWTPYVIDVPGSVPLAPLEPGDEVHLEAVAPAKIGVIKTPAEAAAAVPAPRPFTKADQAGRKKR